MSRVHLGMTRPIKQFVKHYTKLLNLAISSLNDKNLSNDFEDLFDVNKISSNKNNYEYELISFLIIKSD